MKNKLTQKIKVGIVGGSGYVAGELLRCLINHPNTEIDFVYSHSHSDKKISEIHTDLFHSDLVFSQKLNPQIDIVFLCLGHGNSTRFLLENPFSETTKIIDLSNDFRLNKDKSLKVNNGKKELEFVYGLPEIYAQKIKKSNYIANPGCFATAIQLGTLPLTAHFPNIKEWHVHALTGSTGAGQSLSETTHFSWRNENVSIYKPFVHQHVGEIEQSLKDVSQNFEGKINFIPMRGNFTRGIFATMYATLDENLDKKLDKNTSEEDIIFSYQDFYKDAPFVKISTQPIDLKQVVNTNYCLLHIQKIENKILVTSCIDNLLKGAAGQAIENMNLQFDFPQETGLAFKANYF